MPWSAAVGALVGAVATNAMSGGGDTKPSATQQPAMTPEQQQALQSLLARLQGPGGGSTPYTGQLSTDGTPGIDASLSALEEYSKTMMANKANLHSSGPTDTSAMFKDTIENPSMKAFRDEILPGITKRYKGNAAFGSDRRYTEAKAGGALADSLTAARTKLQFDTTEAAKNRELQYASLSNSADSNISTILQTLLGGNALKQQTQQGGLDRQYADFLRGDAGRNTNISQILAALGLNPTNTVVTPGQPGFFTSAAPGIGSALTTAAMQRWLNSGGTPPAGGNTGWANAGGGSTYDPNAGGP